MYPIGVVKWSYWAIIEVMSTDKTTVLRSLQVIPGVGESIALDIYNLGYRSVNELGDADPEDMYEQSCLLAGTRIDRCLLYVYRCAVYYAKTEKPDNNKLKWWIWKD